MAMARARKPSLEKWLAVEGEDEQSIEKKISEPLDKNEPVSYIEDMKTKGEQTKQRILDTAAELFWQNSYQGVNTNTISQTAGVNKATLYRYFPSKDELALAVLENYCNLGIEYVFESNLQATDDPLEQLEGIYQRVYEIHKQTCDGGCNSPGCLCVNLAVEMSTANPELRLAVEQCFAKFGAYYLRIVRNARQRGISAATLDEEQAANALLNLMNGVMVSSKFKNRPEEILDTLAVARFILLS